MILTFTDGLQLGALLVIATAFVVTTAVQSRRNRETLSEISRTNREALIDHERREEVQIGKMTEALEKCVNTFADYTRENSVDHQTINRSLGRLEGKLCRPQVVPPSATGG